MPLDQSDLQAIDQLINRSLDVKLAPLHKDLGQIKQELAQVKKVVNKVKKDTSDLLDFFDRDLMKQARRLDRIDSHLDLAPID